VRNAALRNVAGDGVRGLRDLIRVTIRNGETPEKLLQRFKRTVAKEGLLKEIKKRNYYEKPSEARRRRAREQEKLLRKKARKKVIKDLRRKRRR
jgi:small subunit ribosomal protein S21